MFRQRTINNCPRTILLVGELSFAEHIKQISNGCFHQLRQLWSIRRLLTKESAKTLFHVTVLSRVDYCNSVLNRVCAVHLRPLHSVLRSAARLVLRVRKYDHISTSIRDDLHWLPVDRRIEFKTCALVYKCLHGVAPEYQSCRNLWCQLRWMLVVATYDRRCMVIWLFQHHEHKLSR